MVANKLSFYVSFLGNYYCIYAALDLFFINDTPRLHGGMRGSVLADFATNRQNIQIRCRLRGFERQHEDCMFLLILQSTLSIPAICMCGIIMVISLLTQTYSTCNCHYRFNWYILSS